MKRLLGIGLLCLFFHSAYAGSVTELSTEEETRAHALFAQLRCEVCEGQSLAGSNARLAVEMRELIRQQIAAGQSDADILGYFSQRYGDSILMNPPLKSQTYLLWGAPALFVAMGGVVLALLLRRQKNAA